MAICLTIDHNIVHLIGNYKSEYSLGLMYYRQTIEQTIQQTIDQTINEIIDHIRL